MIEKITMPQLGESVTEGTITSWFKQPGDEIQLYEPICEVTTDKVNAEVPATVAGRMVNIIAEEGTTVAVGDAICTIEQGGEASGTSTEEYVSKQPEDTEEVVSNTSYEMKKRYSPVVLRLAQEHAIDLEQIVGSGREGRITRKDVLAYLEQRKTMKSEVQPQHEKTIKQEEPTLTSDREIALTPVRRAIAERMVKSKHEVPHAWMMMECDVTKLVRLRQRVKNAFLEREGIQITYLPFFIKAVVEALKQYPRLNSVWAGDKIVEKSDINISVAIAGEDALYTPVIHQADRLSILGIAKVLHKLIRKASAGELAVNDMQGGTFTVNNTGTFGSIASAPIINTPQAAIITMEAVVKRPVILNDAIAIRDMVNFCLSLDHRILDGLMVGKFMQAVKQKMEVYGEDTPLY